jgi:hypothetical protein
MTSVAAISWHVLWRDREFPPTEARERLTDAIDKTWGVRLDPEPEVLRHRLERGGEGSEYWLVKLRPDQASGLKELLLKHRRPPGDEPWNVDEESELGTQASVGDWWRPEALEERDVFLMGIGPYHAWGFWFALSKRTGHVYVLRKGD